MVQTMTVALVRGLDHPAHRRSAQKLWSHNMTDKMNRRYTGTLLKPWGFAQPRLTPRTSID